MTADTLPPLAPIPEVLSFLAARRSRPAKTLSADAPEAAEIRRLIAIAARSPDHGKLEPWRFVVLSRGGLDRLALAAEVRAVERAMAPEAAAKAVANFRYGGAAVAVIASPRASDKIPDWEQALSAGAVCMQLLTAALAAGWGANWLTGPFAADEAFLTGALGTAPGEYVAGFIHLGRETAVPPERPRPNLDAVVTWID